MLGLLLLKVIGENVSILPYTVIEKSVIENSASLGPFARIRPDSKIGEVVRLVIL